MKNLVFKYRVLSVEHFGKLQEDIDKLDREGKLSDNKTYRSYIEKMKFKVPEELPEAKYIIVLAMENKLALINFHLDGKVQEVMISPGYYLTGISNEDLTNLISTDIIKEPGYKVERAKGIHLKLLAVRSGLGRYGRNNICYVDELGSFIALYGYFTDYDFKEDNLYEKRMLDQCEKCRICMNKCPSKCIREENFVIDVNKCITLYNEVEGEFPEWIKPTAHNALFGCMRCQMYCPANSEVMKNPIRFEDATEEETKMLLESRKEEELVKSLGNKLHMFTLENYDTYLPILKRNLKVLLR